MNKRVLLVLAALAASSALIVGCGSGGGTTESSGPLTKAEFIKQGDAICKKGNGESKAEVEEFADEKGFDLENPSKRQSEEVVTEVLVPNLERQAEELAALEPPKGDTKEVNAIIASLEKVIAELKKAPSNFGVVAFAKPIRLEGAYGFKVCGGG
ncbi:MAG TPA: hypothetical protein VNM38_07030 [Solirubrobacterales bacterium]|nr:hypothetical protein [Solirubrobacterales bacterium]